MNFRLKEFFVLTADTNFIDEFSFTKLYRATDVSEADKEAFLQWMEEQNVIPATGRGMIAFEDKDSGKILDLKEFAKKFSREDIMDILSKSTNVDVKKWCRVRLDEMDNKPKKEWYSDVVTTKFSQEPKLGWLAPDGSFFETGWGEHEEWAGNYINIKEWNDEQKLFSEDGGYRYSKDFLIHKKNFILLDNPSQDGHTNIVLKRDRRMTAAQEKFLTDYFIELGDKEAMNELFK